MDTATARARLERMLQWSTAPALTVAEVDDLILYARTVDADGYDYYDTWAAGTIYTVGAYRVPTVANGYAYQVTVAGTSHATTQPTWPTTSGATVTDGTATWQNSGQYLWTPTYSLNRAAAEGWLWKAAKVAASYDVAVGSGKDFKRSQQYAMCVAMARQYGGGGASGFGSVRLASATARV